MSDLTFFFSSKLSSDATTHMSSVSISIVALFSALILLSFVLFRPIVQLGVPWYVCFAVSPSLFVDPPSPVFITR
jgi:hypothetical protein